MVSKKVSDSVSKNFGIGKSFGIGFEKIWYRKKYRYWYRKKIGIEKSIGFGIEKNWYRKKNLDLVSFIFWVHTGGGEGRFPETFFVTPALNCNCGFSELVMIGERSI